LRKVFGKYLEFLKEKKALGEKFSAKAQRVLNAHVVIVKNLLTSLTNWNDELVHCLLSFYLDLLLLLLLLLFEILSLVMTRKKKVSCELSFCPFQNQMKYFFNLNSPFDGENDSKLTICVCCGCLIFV
jgi:hypothetical protein